MAGPRVRRLGTGVAVLSVVADRVMAMKDGVIVEEGMTERLLSRPLHDYTRELLGAAPRLVSAGH